MMTRGETPRQAFLRRHGKLDDVRTWNSEWMHVESSTVPRFTWDDDGWYEVLGWKPVKSREGPRKFLPVDE